MERKRKTASNKCEDCEYYDYDEIWDTSYCKMDLDMDEAERFAQKQTSACPYFKYYDEYTFVKTQN